MVGEALDDATHLQIPNDHLRVFAGASDESIALAHIDICDEVKVPVQAGLQSQRVSVPYLENPTTLEIFS